MKFRLNRELAESALLLGQLAERPLGPRTNYNLVVQDAEPFCGWAGIQRIQGDRAHSSAGVCARTVGARATQPRPPSSCSTSPSSSWRRQPRGQLVTPRTWRRSVSLTNQPHQPRTEQPNTNVETTASKSPVYDRRRRLVITSRLTDLISLGGRCRLTYLSTSCVWLHSVFTTQLRFLESGPKGGEPA